MMKNGKLNGNESKKTGDCNLGQNDSEVVGRRRKEENLYRKCEGKRF